MITHVTMGMRSTLVIVRMFTSILPVPMIGVTRVKVESAHLYAPTSIETMRNSSPLSKVTSKLPQEPHIRIGRSSMVSASHS